MALGSAGVVLGAAQPWLTTGRVERSAFALARSARRLGLADGTLRRLALHLLFATPLLVGIVIALVAWHRPRWAIGPSVLVGLIGLVGGLAGFTIPGDRAAGPILTMLCGVFSVVGGVACAAHSARRNERGQP